jgi:transposase
MYVEVVPNRNSPPAVLLREGWREGKKICKRTIANLSRWPPHKVEALRRLLRDEPLMSPDDVFSIERSLPYGHVAAILGTIGRIGLDRILAAKRCRERDLVVAMIVQRLIAPRSKLETVRLWRATTLGEELGVVDADEDDLYGAMDWLLARQDRIEKKLAGRHLEQGGLVLYDVSSSYYEGHSCPLAQYGYDRDGKRGKPIVVYGMMADSEGRPVAMEVYPGSTGDPTTVPDQVEKLRERFGLGRIVLIGDRGMLTETQIGHLREHPGIGWISALRSTAIRALVESGQLQLSLFDEQNLAETTSPDFPGERLVACYNPLLAEERRRKRNELLTATEQLLEGIVQEVARRTNTPLSKVEIAEKVGRKKNRYKVGKHFDVTVGDGYFSFARKEDEIRREAELDGIYVIRTSEPAERLSAQQAVRNYKNLTLVEAAFRCLKGIDLRIRPINHYRERRVRAHIFLCMLAYYVEWHMRKALAPLLFQDEKLAELRKTRDPVARATASDSAKRKKKRSLHTADRSPIHSFGSLVADLGTLCRNQCRLWAEPDAPVVYRLTAPTPLQQKAMQLLGLNRSQ